MTNEQMERFREMKSQAMEIASTIQSMIGCDGDKVPAVNGELYESLDVIDDNARMLGHNVKTLVDELFDECGACGGLGHEDGNIFTDARCGECSGTGMVAKEKAVAEKTDKK